MKFILSLALLLLTLSSEAQQKVSYLKMQRTACFGRCPEYTVELFKTGKLIYTGRKNVTMLGKHLGKLPLKDMTTFLKRISKYKLISAKTLYKNKISDLPRMHMTFKLNGKNKSITNAESGPAYLEMIAKQVDSLVGAAIWEQEAIEGPLVSIEIDSNQQAAVSFEQIPEYKGGNLAIRKFMDEHLVYPEKMKSSGMAGVVNCLVTVGTDGKVLNVKVTQGMGSLFNQEAIRVVNLMTDWKPGMLNGKPVEMDTMMYVEFSPDK